MKFRLTISVSIATVALAVSVLAGQADKSERSGVFDQTESRSSWLVPSHQAACCVGLTGNVDCDGSDGVDISDLSALIDFLYISFTPLCCPAEANVDGDLSGGIDISDLSALIDYLYISFTPTAPCGVEFSSFAAQVQPVFTNNCAVSGCHAGEFPSAGLNLSSGNSHGALVNVVSNGYAPAVRVVPSDTLSSVLFHKVKGTAVYGSQMPPLGSLTPTEIRLIILWIVSGAPNN